MAIYGTRFALLLRIGFSLDAILFWIRRRKWNAMSVRDATLPFN